MFPSVWTERGVVTSEHGKVVIRTDVSASRIVVKTVQDIPSRDILKYNILKRESSDDRTALLDTSKSFPHAGISIDPITGVPIHDGSTGNKGGKKSDTEIENIYEAVGANAQESWEFEVHQIPGPIYYWEAEVLSSVNSDNDMSSVAIGLVPSYDTSEPFTHFLNIADAVAYMSSGSRVAYGTLSPFAGPAGAGFGTHDVVGCGWEIGGRGSVFFTCNGRVIGKPLKGYGSQGQTYNPALELVGAGTTVRTNLGNDKFQFDTVDLIIANQVMVVYDHHHGASIATAPDGSRGSQDVSIWTGVVKSVPQTFKGANAPSPARSKSMSTLPVPCQDSVGAQQHSLSGVYGLPLIRRRPYPQDRVASTDGEDPPKPLLSHSVSSGASTGNGGGSRGSHAPPQHPLTPLNDRHIQAEHADLFDSASSNRRNGSWATHHLRYDHDDDLAAIVSALTIPDDSQRMDMGEGGVAGVGGQWSEQDTSSTREALLLLQGILESVNRTYEDASAAESKAERDAKVSEGGRERRVTCLYDAENVSEILASVTANLGRLQRKMLRAINGTPEDSTLDALLHLNDAVSFTLNSAKSYITARGLPDYDLFAAADHIPTTDVSTTVTSRGTFDMTDEPVADDVIVRDRRDSLTPLQLPSVVSILYMLRRGSRSEMSMAVSQLLAMCGHGSSASVGTSYKPVDAINDIRSAGGLQTLVSALGRCAEWPDVELQISTAIAVMVANESDWHLLVKDVHAILSSLHMLLLKSRVSEDDLACRDNRQLVAAAISRLCLVLCAEWGKPTTTNSSSCGSFHGFNDSGFTHVAAPDTDQLPSSVLDFHRQLSGSTTSSHGNSGQKSGEKELLKTPMLILRILCPAPPKSPQFPPLSETALRGHHPTNGRGGGGADRLLHHQQSVGLPRHGGLLGSRGISDDVGGGGARGRASSYTVIEPVDAIHLPPTTRVHSMGHIVPVDDSSSPRLNPLHRSLSEASGMNSMGLSGQPVEVHSLVAHEVESHQHFGLHTMNLVEEEPAIDDTIVQCSVALSNLAQIDDFRAALVADGALELLTRWLDMSAEVLSWHNTARLMARTPQAESDTRVTTLSGDGGDSVDLDPVETAEETCGSSSPRTPGDTTATFHRPASPTTGVLRSASAGSETTVGGVIPPGHPVYELINNIGSAVASLTSSTNLPSGAVSASGRERRHSRQSNYTIGWIDAQVMAEGLLSAIGRFIRASTYDYTSATYLQARKVQSPILPRGGALALSTALCALASRAQNRSPLLDAGALHSILRLLVDAISRRRLLDHDHRMDDDTTETYPTEELGPLKLQRLQREQDAETAYLRGLSKNCFNMLSYFLADSIATMPVHQPPTSKSLCHSPPMGPTAPVPSQKSSTVVALMIHPQVMDAVKYICNQPKGPPRLAALRVVSMLIEWPEALDAIYSQRITDILMVIVAESNDSYEYDMEPCKPTPADRGSSAGSSKAGSDDFDERIVTNESLEVLMRACYTLSHICEAKLRYALELFENGLMTIMLRTVKHEHVEVQRQAVRCISSMCPVLSSLIPGRHPSVVVEKLKTEGPLGKVMRSRSDSVNEIRAKTARLHINVMAFVEALHALANALTSPSFLVQREALKGISFLANDDHLRVGIVEGPLRVIIRIMVDPSCENELRSLAELVLVNIGFHNGKKDLEIVANDYELLSDWFYMRRSLRPQALGVDLLHQWIDTLFYGSEIAERKTKQHFLLAELGREASLDDIEEDSLFLHLPNGVDVDLRDTLDLLGLSVVKTMIERMVRPHYPGINRMGLSSVITPINPHAGLREALLQQFSHLFDAWVMLRSGIQPDYITSDKITSVLGPDIRVGDDPFPPPSTLGRIKTGHITEKFFAFISFCSGRTTAMNIMRDEEHEHRELLAATSFTMDRNDDTRDGCSPISKKSASGAPMPYQPSKDTSSRSSMSGYHHNPDADLDDSWNTPHPKVLELLDLFFPSRLYQMYLMDLFSLGEHADPIVLDGHNEVASASSGVHVHEMSHRFRVPEPRNFRALLLPSRSYLSFRREGRVIERIISDVASVEHHLPSDHSRSRQAEEASYMGGYVDLTSTMWTLCFRDSSFQGEFGMTLLSTLRRCPQIFSLNFVSRRPEQDSELGLLVGSVPSTIRFVSMDNSLSSPAIEVMCVMIRTQNAAFAQGEAEISGDMSVSDTEEGGRDGSMGIGLQGLAIKNTVLTASDIKNLCEMLDPTEEYLIVMTGKFAEAGGHRESGEREKPIKVKSVDSGSSLPSPVSSYRLYGLKYLDLSDNRLSDEYCSNIICACVGGPLEGLELRGNYVHRGLYFCTPLTTYLSSSGCQLRYLGLSSNGLVNASFRSVLDACQACLTMTILDLSNNIIAPSDNNRLRIREFFKKNNSLRSLNLSYNRFTSEMSRVFYLGLLENDTLIVLRLEGNLSYNNEEMRRAKKKLKLNRDRYVSGRPTAHPPHTTQKEPVHAHVTIPSASHADIASHDEVALSPSPGSPILRPAASGDSAVNTSTPVQPIPIAGVTRNSQTDVHTRFRMDGRAASASLASPVDLTLRPGGVHRQLSYDDVEHGNLSSGVAATPTAVPVIGNNQSSTDVVSAVAVAMAEYERDDDDWIDDIEAEDANIEEVGVGDIVSKNVLCVLYSAPLAWTDTRNQLHPIQTLDYAGERETLVQVFREAQRDIGLRFDFATTDTLRTAVTMGCRALHFSGHGHPHCLNFEDGRSGLQFVTVEQLRALCQAGGLKLDFVFVSACYSRRAAEAFAEAGVPHVVCVHVDAHLLDAAAMAFTRAFYLALLLGHAVGHAFDIGKQALATSPYVPNSSVEGSKFMLLPEDGDHDMPVFKARTVRRWPSSSTSLRGLTCELQDISHLPRPPEDFEGREIDMHNTIRVLLNRRLVTLVGEAGVGKSSVVVAVCSYMSERRYFTHGIVFVRLQGVMTYERMLVELSRAISAGPARLSRRFAAITKTFEEGVKGDSKHAPAVGSGGESTYLNEDPIRGQEEMLLHCLASVKVLIVLDHLNDLLTSNVAENTATDLKMFLSRMLERCRDVKVLTTSTDPIGLGHGFGMVEHCVSIGSLSLRSSLRLFARLSPFLFTAAEKVQFVRTLLIPDQADVTLESRELSSAAAQILYMLGGGHPGKIVKIACETDKSSVMAMVQRGEKVVGAAMVSLPP